MLFVAITVSWSSSISCVRAFFWVLKTANPKTPPIANRRVLEKSTLRQGLRRLSGLVFLMAFPVTLNFYSPFVSQVGAWQGIVAGSLILFASLFVSALLLGRSFCAWACPAGAFQDLLRPLRNKRVLKSRWVKFVVFVPWLGLLLLGLWRNRPLTIYPLFLTESGVSVSDPAQYMA